MTRRLAPLAFAGLALAGCHTDMWRQPKTEPLGLSQTMFTDGAMSRPLVPGTIAQGHLREDSAYFSGIDAGGKWLTALPDGLKPKDPATLLSFVRRGQDRYRAYCTPCHGQLGNGEGMIAHRGFALRRPVGNYHTERLRNMPIGHFYDVMTNGYGAMYSYASRVEPQDRWAIAAYIRALQLSQDASPADVSAAQAIQPASAPANPAPGAEGMHE